MIPLLALTGCLPALLAMFYFDRLDIKREEPRSALRRVAFFGGLACIPAVFIELGLMKVGPEHGIAGALFKAFIVAALTEEVLKALVVRWFVWNRPEFDERMDGITYGTRAGLGFALVENIGYLLGTKSIGAFVGMYVARALLAVPMHAIAGGVMGYFAARRRFDKTGPGVFGGLALAILIHGTYDGAVFLMPELAKDIGNIAALILVVPILTVIIGFIAIRRMAKKAISLDELALAQGYQQVQQRAPQQAYPQGYQQQPGYYPQQQPYPQQPHPQPYAQPQPAAYPQPRPQPHPHPHPGAYPQAGPGPYAQPQSYPQQQQQQQQQPWPQQGYPQQQPYPQQPWPYPPNTPGGPRGPGQGNQG